MTRLAVTYNTKAHIAAVGPSVWAKLGPEDWFDTYKIVVANSRDYRRPFVVDLGLGLGDYERATTETIVSMPQFITVAQNQLADYAFVAYKAIAVPGGMSKDRFVTNDSSFSRFEDKKVFRELFAETLPVPEHSIVALDDVLTGDPSMLYESYARQFGDTFVLQDNLGGGGRGTYIIRTSDDLKQAVDTLRTERKGTHVIVSRYIVNSTERSVQVFVSDTLTLTGPLQQQLVRNSELLNPHGRGGMYFCGGKFITNAPAEIREQYEHSVAVVAEKLKTEGYKGIFGLDFLLDESGKLWVIEINARTTGLLPLLNEQEAELPMYLLHILELAGLAYEIGDSASRTPVLGSGPESFVVLFNQTGETAALDASIATGNYTFKAGQLVQLDDNARWNRDADCMIQLFASASYPAKPNLKLCNIFLRHGGFDDQGELLPETRALIGHIKSQIRPN